MPASSPHLAMLLAALAAIGPFAIDTYLPAFPAMAASLSATQIEVQQTLTAYMVMFALMSLWHGVLSDCFGRRSVIIVATALFALASLVCALAPSIEWLWLGRALQGMAGGAGMIVGRAVIRDLFEGAQAQRLMSRVTMIFAVAPAIAPLVGGVLLVTTGWRSIFVFLTAFSGLLTWMTWRMLPETLPRESRQKFSPMSLARSYWAVLTSATFLLIGGALALNFNGFFVYILSAPVFLMQHLGLKETQFAWLFVPTVVGLMGGSMVSGKVAGRWSATRTVGTGFALMVIAALGNVLHAAFLPLTPFGAVLPVAVYTFGMSLTMPTLTLMALDLFPAHRGMVSSCQSFMQVGTNAVTAGLLAPVLWATPLALSTGMSVFLALGLLCCTLALLRVRRVSR